MESIINMKIIELIKKIRQSSKYLSCLIPSAYINFKALPLKQAILFPILINWKCQVRGIQKGSIVINGRIQTGMIQIGIGSGVKMGPKKKNSYVYIEKNAKIIFNGVAQFAQGNSLHIKNGGVLNFGSNFSSNIDCDFFVYQNVSIGDECVCGWNISIRDGDGHYIVDKTSQTVLNSSKPIVIGNKVWLCSNVVIMKGINIGNNIVIATNSLVLSDCLIDNSIYGGSPTRKLKNNIDWIRDGRGYK